MHREGKTVLKTLMISFALSVFSGVVCPPSIALLTQQYGFNLSSWLSGALPLFLPPYVIAFFLLVFFFAKQFPTLDVKGLASIGIAFLIGPLVGMVLSLPIVGFITGQAL